MITLMAITGHLFLNLCLGWAALRFSSTDRNWAENVVVSLLLGIYLEIIFIAYLIFIGIPLKESVFVLIVLALVLMVVSFWKGNAVVIKVSIDKLKWYEWVLIFSITEKVAFGIWNLIYTPLYFDDAMVHWSGRGRSLFGVVNWSFNPDSPVFLGYTGSKHYPLLTPVWRAVTAIFNGEWNDIIARVDGLVFYLSIIATVWLIVWRFSHIRWLAGAAAFIISALPLQIWHAVAGYSDIALEAFAIASLAALLRQEWLLAGVFAAGTAWSKNEGLAFYIPELLIAVILLQFSSHKVSKDNWFQKKKYKSVLCFLLGLMTLIPWFLFKFIYSLGLAPKGMTSEVGKISLHAGSLNLFFERVVSGSSHSMFWVFIFLSICFTFIRMYKDKNGRALLCLFLTSLSAIVFVFTCTDAYLFLLNEMTIHRSMLQFYGIAVITVTYGVWLSIYDHMNKIKP